MGLSRYTFSRWLLEYLIHLPPFRSSILPAQADEVLERDERGSFVWHKGRKRWLGVALNRPTRQIVAFVIGDRFARTCRKLGQRIPDEYPQGRSYRDFWRADEPLSSTGKHPWVGKESDPTAHLEPWNCTLRQPLPRYVRMTLSFSKSDKFHHLVTKWFIFDYNLSLTF